MFGRGRRREKRATSYKVEIEFLPSPFEYVDDMRYFFCSEEYSSGSLSLSQEYPQENKPISRMQAMQRSKIRNNQ